MPICKSCNSEVNAGTRWCNICHTNVVNPEIGRLASPIKRLGAYFLDLIVPVVVIVIISGGVSESSKNQIDDDTTAMFASGVILIYAVVALILFARGTTIGKRMLGMWVIKEDGKRAGFFTMLIREVVGKFISGFVLLLGYLWILFDKENQGWHDKLVNTYVIG